MFSLQSVEEWDPPFLWHGWVYCRTWRAISLWQNACFAKRSARGLAFLDSTSSEWWLKTQDFYGELGFSTWRGYVQRSLHKKFFVQNVRFRLNYCIQVIDISCSRCPSQIGFHSVQWFSTLLKSDERKLGKKHTQVFVLFLF